MAFLKVKNLVISTLASGISDSDLSLTVATGEGALFPTTGDFHLSLDTMALREIVKCTSRTGDVCTIVRAQEGTAAAAHTAGKAVKLGITAGVVENVQAELTTHNTAPLGSSVHENPTLFQGYLSANQADIPAAASWAIRFDTESIDLGNCYDISDWYGTAAAYRPADADSDATHIEDDDATFTAWLLYAFVQWTDSADANPGTGYVTAWDVDTLTIVKASGANFTASGKYYIKKGHYVVPTTGTYVVAGNCRIATTEADKRYAFGLRSAVAPYGNGDLTQHVSHNVQASMAAAMTNTWSTIVHLTAGHLVQWVETPVGLAAAYTIAGDAVQPYYTWGAIYLLRAD